MKEPQSLDSGLYYVLKMSDVWYMRVGCKVHWMNAVDDSFDQWDPSTSAPMEVCRPQVVYVEK